MKKHDTDGMKRFEELAAAARREQAPGVDVTDRVLQSLRERDLSPGHAMEKPLLMFSAVSFASAVIVAIIAAQTWFSGHDPLVDMIGSLAMVMK